MASVAKISPLDFLTDQERDAVELFIQNEHMREGVRKILLDKAEHMGVQVKGSPSLMTRNFAFGLDPNGTMTDDGFGRAIRVHLEAIVMVEQAFEKMKELIPTPEEKTPKNPAV